MHGGMVMFKKTDLMHQNISVFLSDDELIEYIREYTEGETSVELDDLYDIIEEFIIEGQD
jgi:hypothetical protein